MNVEDDIEEAVISYKKPLPGLALPNYRTSLPSSTSIKNDGAVIQQQGTLNWDALEPLLALTSQQLGNRKWVGLFSIHRPEKAGYEYKAVPLGFSQEVLAEAAGNTRPFFLEYNKTTSDSTHVYGVFIATIPDSDLAEQQLRQAIMGPAEASQKQIAKAKPIQLSSQDRCWEVISGDGGELDFLPTMCVEIVVTAPRIPFPPIDEIWDDEWGPYNWEPSGGGGASNGNENCFIVEGLEMRPCDEEEEEKLDKEEEIRICHTRDIHLDHPAVQEKMEEIWNTAYGADDNSPLPQSERRESLWAIEWRGGNDYTFIEATGGTVTSCSMRGVSIGTTRDTNGNRLYLVGLLHVEPFEDGEEFTDVACLESKTSMGDSIASYGSEPSSYDRNVASIMNAPVYVLSKNKIRVIEPTNNEKFNNTYSRCGY